MPRLFIRCRVDSALKLAQRPSASWQIHRIGGVGAGKNPCLATSFGRPASKAPQHKAHFTALSETVPPPIRPIYHLGQVPPKAWSAGITRAKSLAFIGSARAAKQNRAEIFTALSITRLEGSRWRGGRLWSWNRDPRAWKVVGYGAVDARAAPDPVRLVARAARRRGATCWLGGLRHTAPDTWAATLTRAPVVTREGGVHEVS